MLCRSSSAQVGDTCSPRRLRDAARAAVGSACEAGIKRALSAAKSSRGAKRGRRNECTSIEAQLLVVCQSDRQDVRIFWGPTLLAIVMDHMIALIPGSDSGLGSVQAQEVEVKMSSDVRGEQ